MSKELVGVDESWNRRLFQEWEYILSRFENKDIHNYTSNSKDSEYFLYITYVGWLHLWVAQQPIRNKMGQQGKKLF